MINNASNFSFAKSNQMPNMAQTIESWLIPLTFGVVTKQQNGYYTREVVVNKNFRGVWQPLNFEQLRLKPEGERSWKWFWCHTPIDLELKTDDVIIYLGTQYRVMGAKDYSLNGFYEYELVEDFHNSGPYEEEPEDEPDTTGDDDGDTEPDDAPGDDGDDNPPPSDADDGLDAGDDSPDGNTELNPSDSPVEDDTDEGGEDE